MDYRFGPNASVEEIHHSLDAHGVAIVEGFLAAPLLERLREEWRRLLAGDVLPGVKKERVEDFTHARKIDFHAFDWSGYSAVGEVVGDERIAEIMAYREYEPGPFPEYVLAQRTMGRFEGAEVPPQYEMHTDGIQAHRFMFYLSDVGPDDGPLTIAPGKYHEFKRWRDEQRAKGQGGGLKYKLVPEMLEHAVPMTGPAGTMVTFFTDSPHRAGIVATGHEREIFRINAGAFKVEKPTLGSRVAGALSKVLGSGDGDTPN